ncbi:uncharacterized protein EV422DRAFT_168502 [Fimicolochytrium jonesii]|uniref:uncharacterized protein n=1 Tax=Fimicolochytrium jonesii TaxID=1396493 RepID=UPI0022FE6810|nr:uncharacterized protein EV422DRAFT_168502 [Fimicolochytrium jonesii]KAI8818482.1 hypothetical protein EV422DRAFT_168502 [Fimicolochytrium jonesii]
MKQRFSTLDVSAQVAELRPRLVGLRLQNVYDVTNKVYLLKFSRPDNKEMLLVESGIRVHSTEFARDKNSTPSHFCMKLRKHLRTRRLTGLDQLGADRVMDLRFGEGEHAYHLLLEFYASGNVILTDWEYRILALLRVVEIEGAAAGGADGAAAAITAAAATASGPADAATGEKTEGDTKFAVGEIYDTTRIREFEVITEEKIRAVLESAVTEAAAGASQKQTAEDSNSASAEDAQKRKGGKGGKAGGKGKTAGGGGGGGFKSAKDKKANDLTLRRVIRDKLGHDYGPALVEHCILRSELDASMKVTAELDLSSTSHVVQALLRAFREGDAIVKSCMDSPQKGWITVKQMQTAAKPSAGAAETAENTQSSFVAYNEFHPFLFQQFATSSETDPHADPPAIEYPSFDKCVDEFFSKLEAQKLEMRARQAELNAIKKLDSVKAGHMNQVRGLVTMQEQSAKVAQTIEANLALIESLINTVRSFIASGMDWGDLEELVKEEKKNGNPVASVISKLKLDVGMVNIRLRDATEEDSDDDEDDATETESEDESGSEDDENMNSSHRKKRDQPKQKKPQPTFLSIDIDIYASAYANARRYYDTKKVAAVKQDKTLQAASKALKSAERKIETELKTTQKAAPAAITKMRKPFWFEKFLWFISSENYLVVGGRDAGQNELLVRRYLGKGDIYVHADLHGAASVIVKNVTDPDAPAMIPPTTLHQAGTMSVCQSRAWDTKIVTSAWWVEAGQVSKTAPTGEYLTTGSFMIRGKKNWLPPVQLVYGFGLLFRVDDSSAGRHYWERRPWRGDAAGGGVVEAGGEKEMESNESLVEDVELDDAEGNDDAAAQDNEGADGEDDAEAEPATAREDQAGDDEANGGASGSGSESSDNEDADDIAADPSVSTPPLPTDTSINTPVIVSTDDKYGLAELNQDNSDDDDLQGGIADILRPNPAGPVVTKKRLTAKERRDLKKQKAGGGVDDGSVDSRDDKVTPAPQRSNGKDADALAKGKGKNRNKGADQPAQQQQPQQQQVRGKRGKIKKLKSKYADQDEEDREMMLELLGSRGPAGTKAAEEGRPTSAAVGEGKKGKGGRQQEAVKVKGGKQPQQPQQVAVTEKQQSGTVTQTRNGIATPESTTPTEQQTAAAHADLTRRNSTSTAADSLEITRLLAEENISYISETATFLDTLTGQPHPSDILLHAIPVCAPWSALQKYAYKAKLMPGGLKKGKAVKSLVSAFVGVAEGRGRVAEGKIAGRKIPPVAVPPVNGTNGDENPSPATLPTTAAAEETTNEEIDSAKRQKELIRAIPEMEMMNALLGKVKVVLTQADAAAAGGAAGGGKGGKGKGGRRK